MDTKGEAAPAARFVVAKNQHGVGLAMFVEDRGDQVVIRRAKGPMYRLGRIPTFKPIVVPKTDVLRDATPRELVLGHPV